jgi:tetratricopeptide (TPR) repeat protein
VVNVLKTNVLAEPILVGREHELEELQALLNSAVAGKGTTVFISGEAGAGKTRLATEFLNQAKKQAVTILNGWCLSNAAVPYFPFFEAFSSYFSAEHGEKVELKNWLMGPSQTDKFGNPQTVTPQVWKDQTFTAVANTLSTISAKNPMILFIDDLHWADSASLALIHYLAFTVNSEKVLVLATFRSEQLVADDQGRTHPLVETLRLMRRQDLIKEINVTSLDQTSVSNLAKNMLGGGLQQDLVQKLAGESQGNPLFVVESLRMLHGRNNLVFEGDKWRLTSSAIGIPPKIKDIILQRLDTLSRNQREVLDAASVLGEKFDENLLASVLGIDSMEIIKLLDLISKGTSLVRCEGELYRFDHARTRDAIYDDISPALKKVIHAKVADKLERMNKNGNIPLSDLAYQYAQAGNKQKGVKYALAAGQDALAKWSNTEAIKHFSFVVQTAEHNNEYAEARVIALEGLGDAYFASNNFQQAITTFEQLADITNNVSKLRALRKALQASFYEGDVSKQKALIQKAEEVKITDRLELARLLHLKYSVIQSPNDWLITSKLWPEVLQVFDEEYALSEAAQIQLWLGYGHAMLGNLENAVACALRSIDLYDELGDFRSQIEAYAYAGGTFQACMLFEQATRMFAKAVEVNEKYKIWDYVRLFPAFVWESLGLVGVDLQIAVSKALKALEYFEKTDSRLYAGAVYGVLIVAHALAEDIAHVDEYYGKLMSLPPYILSNAPTQVFLAPTLGVYYAAKKDFEKSMQYFNQSFTILKSFFKNPYYEASTRTLYAWALGKQGKMEEAKVQLEMAEKTMDDARKRFSHVNILPNLTTLARLEVNQTFPLRLDLVNVSTSQGSIVKVENLPEELKIIEVSPNCILQDGQITFKDNTIKPFEDKTVKLILKATKPTEGDGFKLNPQITYIGDFGGTKTCNPRPLTISVHPAQAKSHAQASSSASDPSKAMEPESDAEIDILKKFGLSHSAGKT